MLFCLQSNAQTPFSRPLIADAIQSMPGKGQSGVSASLGNRCLGFGQFSQVAASSTFHWYQETGLFANGPDTITDSNLDFWHYYVGAGLGNEGKFKGIYYWQWQAGAGYQRTKMYSINNLGYLSAYRGGLFYGSLQGCIGIYGEQVAAGLSLRFTGFMSQFSDGTRDELNTRAENYRRDYETLRNSALVEPAAHVTFFLNGDRGVILKFQVIGQKPNSSFRPYQFFGNVSLAYGF